MDYEIADGPDRVPLDLQHLDSVIKKSETLVRCLSPPSPTLRGVWSTLTLNPHLLGIIPYAQLLYCSVMLLWGYNISCK